MKLFFGIFICTMIGVFVLFTLAIVLNYAICPDYTCSNERVQKAYQDAHDYRYR